MGTYNSNILLTPPKNKWGYNKYDDPEVKSIFDNIIQIVKPKLTYEIGFFYGHSALIWLQVAESNLISFDPVDYAVESSKPLLSAYPDKFKFINSPFRYHLTNQSPDLIFIDGNHKYESVCHDIKESLKCRPKFILFDNVERSDVFYSMDKFNLNDAKLKTYFYSYIDIHKGKEKMLILKLIDMSSYQY